MAESNRPATPQSFTFNGRELKGFMLGFATKRPRRFTVHQYPKRRGAKVEDHASGPQRLEVRLVFNGDSAAHDYAAFMEDTEKNPFGLLVHPIAGQFQAFCEGPNEDVEYSRGLDEIRVQCAWTETQLDRNTGNDVPDVATAAQNVTNQASNTETAIAGFMMALGRAQASVNTTLSTIDAAADTLDVVTAPVDFARTTMAGILASTSHLMGKINGIATRANLVKADIANFIAVTSDLYGLPGAAVLSSDAVVTQLGVVVQDAELLIADLIDSQATPAGAADAAGEVYQSVADCYVLSDAIDQALPPTINYIVPELTDIVTLVMKRYPSIAQPLMRASTILGMNRIPNPAAIPAGTALRIPSD